MNYFDLYSSYPDPTIAAAWDSQIKEAHQAPWVAETLNQRSNELLPRFAACYAELRALPRSARRSLQRQIARSSELAAILPDFLQHGGRRLQHRMAWSLAGAALLLALGQGAATAATITVTTNDPNIIADGQCSLIEAIVNANNDAATHADCAAGSGADTIVLPANANVTLTNMIDFRGLPLITSEITIEGNGATIARQADPPLFQLMANSGDLTLHQVTLSGGFSQGSHRGGAVANYGNLTIEDSTISGNRAGINGGGVANFGTLRIKNSVLSDNGSQYGGAGLSNYGTTAIENSTISSNTDNYTGGGVENFGALSIENSTISDNSSYFAGGGIMNYGTTTVTNSTISGNTAGGGGGIFNSGSLAVINSTISGNTADTGGGIFNSGNLTITDGNISGNNANHGADIFNALAIGATTLLTGEVGVFFVSDLMISGGVAPYIVSITDGKLPKGLSLGNNGIISGTPSPTAKSEKFTLRITDSLNESITQTFTIKVRNALRVSERARTGRIGKNYSASFRIRGGLGPFNWSITSGALPPGLSFSTATGAITGIPTQAGEFPFTLQVTDALGGIAVENLTLKIK